MEILRQRNAGEGSEGIATKLRADDGMQRPGRAPSVAQDLPPVPPAGDIATLPARRQAEFLADMISDLRAPVDSVLVLAKLLADNETNSLTAQQVDFAQAIYAAGTELLSGVDAVLELAGLDGAPGASDLAEQSLRDLRIYLLHAFRQTARERRVAFDVILAADLPAALRTDGKRLRQLLKHLLALAFRSAHGGRVAMSVATDGANAVFEITCSTGDCAKLAAGRGLAVCRELARPLGGDVGVGDSRNGILGNDGARLFLELPMAIPEPAVPAFAQDMPAPLATAALHAGRRGEPSRPREEEAMVLVVEGNAQVAAVVLDLVRANGFQGAVATDIGTMRLLLRALTPQAVLIGGSLLDIDGWSTLELLKRDPQMRRLPVSLSCFEARRYMCLQMSARMEWGRGSAAGMLGALDAAGERNAVRLLLAGVPEGAYGLDGLLAGRQATRAASGAAALAALERGGCDGLVIGAALGDMSAIELLRAISAAGPRIDDLPLAVIDGPAAPLAVSVEVGVLRHRARLEDTLGETERFLAGVAGSRRSPPDAPPSRRREAWPELAGRTALIIDDDVYNVYAMTGALEQQGMSVVLAENAREGIAMLRAHPEIDVVLIDVSMPEIDGDSIVHAIRATHERPLPIVAVTPRAMPGDREKCIRAGASDYLAKPVNIEQMLALLRAWLARLA